MSKFFTIWQQKLNAPFWFLSFSALLFLLPLPFGTNRPFFSNLFALWVGINLIAMLLMAPSGFFSLNSNAPHRRLFLAALGFTLVIIWSFFQVVPWTPEVWHHPIWSEAEGVLGAIGGAISIDPGVFVESLLRFLGYIACFVTAFFAAKEPDKAEKLVKVLAYAAVTYALYGLIVASNGGDTVLWYKKWAYSGFLTSTFVNKNSYATYAGIGLLCCLIVAWQHIKTLKLKDLHLAKKSKLAALCLSLSFRDVVFLSMPIIVLAALTLSGSRAGIASSILGVGTFVLCIAINQKWALQRWATFLGAGFILLIVFIALGGDSLLSRIGNDQLNSDSSIRLAAYALEKQAIQDNPWFGFGLGTFEGAFRLYQNSTMPAWFHHAHNDYLEMIMDLGLPAAIILFGSIGLLLSICTSGVWKRKRNAVYPALAIGASVIVGVHSLVDFGMHIPAVAATFASILGIGTAQSWSSRAEK